MLGLNLGLWQIRQGLAVPFDPAPALAVLATSAGWWEADDVTNVHDGSTFSQLSDLSGNGNHAVQATAAQQPGRLDVGGIISAEGDGVDDMMVVAAPTAALMNNFNPAGGTSMEVTRADAGGFARVWNKTDVEYVVVEQTTGLLFNWTFDFVTNPERRRVDVPQAVGVRHITEMRWSKNEFGDGSMQAGIDGASFTPAGDLNQYSEGAGAATDLSGATFILGNRIDGLRSFNGGTYAVALWPTILSNNDLALVRQYWALKYGVVLA